MRGRRSPSGSRTTTKSGRTAACSTVPPREFAVQAAGFHGKEVGQEASNQIVTKRIGDSKARAMFRVVEHRLVVSSLLCKRPSFVFGVAVVFGDGLQGKGAFPLPLRLHVKKS